LQPRDRINTILNFEEPDRVGLWIELFNETYTKWISDIPYKLAIQKLGNEMTTIGGNLEIFPHGYDEITIALEEKYVIKRDRRGGKKKIQGKVTHELEIPVTSIDEFQVKFESFIDLDDPRRITSDKYPFKADLKKAIKNRQKYCFTNLWQTGPFEICRDFLGGISRVLSTMIRNPSLASYMFEAIAKYQARVCECFIEAGVDGLILGEDLGYRKNTFFSSELYSKLLAPAHKKIFQPFRKLGKPCILHSDGNVNSFIPDFIRIGVTALNPLEVKAGLDVIELKKKYGDKLVFIGGIDVRTLASTKEKIKKEVTEKIGIAGQGGGYIIGPDHCIPPDVSFENFQFFRKLIEKYGKYPRVYEK
jgi:uroporphyrinogen decarboxylase